MHVTEMTPKSCNGGLSFQGQALADSHLERLWQWSESLTLPDALVNEPAYANVGIDLSEFEPL